MKILYDRLRLCLFCSLFAAFTSGLAAAEAAFIVKGSYIDNRGFPVDESYVISLSDDQQIIEARTILADPERRNNTIITARIAPSSDSVNRNFSIPGRPFWSWHVEEVIGFTDISNVRLPNDPKHVDHPSKIEADPAQWIADNGNEIAFVNFYLLAEITNQADAKLINVSTRGYVSDGEFILIAGFIIPEGSAKTVIIRGMGPSLSDMGVSQVIDDPKVALYSGRDLVHENDNWKENQSVIPFNYVQRWLIPDYGREAAFVITLEPGSYTVHLGASNDVLGVGLLEVYDIDDETLF